MWNEKNFHTFGPILLDFSGNNLIAKATSCLGFVHPSLDLCFVFTCQTIKRKNMATNNEKTICMFVYGLFSLIFREEH
jgi:hypothetical protein